MTDITTVGTVLSSIKAAVDIARLIKDSSTSLEQAEIKLHIAKLISALADAKIEVADIQTELIGKDDEINALKSRLTRQESVVWEKPYYWVGVDEKKEGPYCQRCYDSDMKLIHLQDGGKELWRCTACDTVYADQNYVAPKRVYHPRKVV